MEEDKTIIARFTPRHTAPTIACFQCGRPMEANGTSRCNECLATAADIASRVPRTGDITFCKECNRVATLGMAQWVYADRESRELMALLLKRVHLPSELRLIDAQFVWTEPHSRRIVLKVVVQAEQEGVTLEQQVPVVFNEHTMQCPMCAKAQSAHTWTAMVQIRQHGVDHKKTFLWLEQLILREGAQRKTVAIQEGRGGIDFQYAGVDDAKKMCDFIVAHVPAKVRSSSEMLSEDVQQGTAKVKFTYAVELAPVCRDDLVVLPRSLARSKGGIGRLVICHKLNNSLYFINPDTLQICYVNSGEYWRQPFKSLDTSKSLREFVVLDVEPTGATREKFVLADVTVSPANDFNVTYIVRSHLGAILHPGDSVLGYDMTTSQYNHAEFDTLHENEIPDVVLVKKVFPDKQRKPKQRKRMAVELQDSEMREDELEFLDEMEDEMEDEIEEEE